MTMGEVDGRVDMSFSFYLLLQISSPQTSWSDNLDMTQDKDVLPSN